MKPHLLYPPTPVSDQGKLSADHLFRTLKIRYNASARRVGNPLWKGRDLGVSRQAPPPSGLTSETADLVLDLNLEELFNAMAGSDRFCLETVRLLVCTPLTDAGDIGWRQAVSRDACRHPGVFRAVYRFLCEVVEEIIWVQQTTQPGYTEMVPLSVKVQKGVALMSLLLQKCGLLREQVASTWHCFSSEGLRGLSARLLKNYSEPVLKEARRHVAELFSLQDEGRLVLGGRLGAGMKGSGYVLRNIVPAGMKSSSGRAGRNTAFRDQHRSEQGIPLNNISLSRSAEEIENAALLQVLKMVNRLNEELIRFLEQLRFELAFYDGVIRLAHHLDERGIPRCFPEILPEGKGGCSGIEANGLVEAALALTEDNSPVPNDLPGREVSLVVVTGANQGGKSTFLRSLGLAQIMMQCGMFVTANQYLAPLFEGIFTHFAREEDAGMDHGRLEEELARMDRLLHHMTPRSLLLMNESFATTTEREGASIAEELILALRDGGVTLVFVTHLHECAASLHEQQLSGTVFLRAERGSNGVRSFRVLQGAPLPTSYGLDLWESVNGKSCEQGNV